MYDEARVNLARCLVTSDLRSLLMKKSHQKEEIRWDVCVDPLDTQ